MNGATKHRFKGERGATKSGETWGVKTLGGGSLQGRGEWAREWNIIRSFPWKNTSFENEYERTIRILFYLRRQPESQ